VGMVGQSPVYFVIFDSCLLAVFGSMVFVLVVYGLFLDICFGSC
jgi:hypothetical protein